MKKWLTPMLVITASLLAFFIVAPIIIYAIQTIGLWWTGIIGGWWRYWLL